MIIIAIVMSVGIFALQHMVAEVQSERSMLSKSELPQLSDIDALKQESLLKGKIFDRYLIPYELSPENVKYFGGEAQAKEAHERLEELLEISKGDKAMEISNGGTMLLSNFHILADSTIDFDKIAALVIVERIQANTYQQPIEPIQKLHNYLLKEHPVVGDAGKELDMLLGDMKPLAPQVLDILETYTLLGKPPFIELLMSEDINYWGITGSYGNCLLVEEGSDCDKYLEQLNAKPWEIPPLDDAHFHPPSSIEGFSFIPTA